MKLVIAEKPSVAQSLAAVIGATARKNGYLEGNGWRVSWCVGHLAGLADADSYDPKYAKWRYDDLPILPEHWQMVVGKDKKTQFDILKKLMNAPDVTEVVNACDAGREGELIFRSVYELAVEQFLEPQPDAPLHVVLRPVDVHHRHRLQVLGRPAQLVELLVDDCAFFSIMIFDKR